MSTLNALAQSIETFGESAVLAFGGLAIGLLFGLFAQRSRFCMRAAIVEVARGHAGEKVSIWLLTFGIALVAVQVLALIGGLDVGASRQIAGTASLSGALLGGLVFGAGMIMTRGCPSRLVVLASNGNLRALLTGLIFAATVQATLSGVLVPLRSAIGAWWPLDPGPSRSLLAGLGLGHGAGLAIGVAVVALAVALARRHRLIGPWAWAGAIGVGLTVAATWGFSQAVVRNSFEPLAVHGLTFSAPSAEWLMRVLHSPAPKIGFDFGLLPGAVLGAGLGGLIGRDLKIEGFHDGYSMRRYIAGAILMGFGAVLAGGCALGAGVTGGSIFAVTAWVTLVSMWVGAVLTDRLLDWEGAVMPGLSDPGSTRTG